MSYQSHRARRPEVQAAIEASMDLIREGYTYSEAGKVLALSQLKVEKQTFYNLRAKLDLDEELFEDRANGIEEALTELGYEWRGRYTYDIDNLSGKCYIFIHPMPFYFFPLYVPRLFR